MITWFDVLGMRVGLTAAPGSILPMEEHVRQLAEAPVVVNLMEPGEIKRRSYDPQGCLSLAQRGARVFWSPVESCGAPTEEQMAAIITDIDNAGGGVVHCAQGRDRAALVVACMLKEGGSADPIAEVTAARGVECVRFEPQREFLAAWQEAAS